MAHQIEVVLCDPNDKTKKISLFYELLSTNIAKKYYTELSVAQGRTGNGSKILEPER